MEPLHERDVSDSDIGVSQRLPKPGPNSTELGRSSGDSGKRGSGNADLSDPQAFVFHNDIAEAADKSEGKGRGSRLDERPSRGCRILLVGKQLVTGATGFVGRHLCALLDAPNILTRRPETAPPEFDQSACFRWDPTHAVPPAESLSGCEAVFHLAGEPVASGRWTKSKKERIRNSRVQGTQNLVAGLRAMESPPRVLVSASAVGYYGSRGDEELNENSASASGFLAEVCQEWETAAQSAEALGVRVVTLRIGLVLGKDGGALARMLPIFKIGAAGKLGSGKQWVPWIHVEDLARLFVFAAEKPDLSGPINATGPLPVRNSEFTKALGRGVRRPTLLPAPAFALRLALGEFAEVLLASQRVFPTAALNAGFEFRHSTIDSAIAGIVDSKK